MVTYDKKQYNTFKVDFLGTEYEIFLVAEKYADNKTLAVEAYDASDFEPFATLTVNLHDPQQLRKGHAFFDVNNVGCLLGQLTDLGVIKKNTGYKRQSGWCTYPLCEWDLDKFRVGGEKPKYYVDYLRVAPDGEQYGSLEWHFEMRPESETEDIEEAKRNARSWIKDFPYDRKEGVVILTIEDGQNNRLYAVANCSKKTGTTRKIAADEFLDVKPDQQG